MGEARLSTVRETEPNTALTLHPDWGHRAEQRLLRAEHRAAGGRLYTYRWGSYAAFRLPLAFVSEDARALLHDWWRGGERLLFTLDSSAELSHTLCRIVNERAPLDVRVAPLADRWAGLLELEAVNGMLRLGLPFTLDDPALGMLDQSPTTLL